MAKYREELELLLLGLPQAPNPAWRDSLFAIFDGEVARWRIAMTEAKKCIEAQMRTEVTIQALNIIDGVLDMEDYRP